MSTTYLGYHFSVSPKVPGAEILMAELGEKPFESFVETESGLVAYIRKEFWQPDLLDGIYVLESGEFEISHHVEEIDQVNWNEEWEKHFEPINVDGICYVRAPFHAPVEAEYEIVIEPKMSFGTGHHETTHMMIQHLLQTDVTGMKTLDMGSGTAILAILAEMKGAGPIDAIDIDHWCYLNAIENAERNQCKQITVYEGDASLLKDKHYDLIIANINRNILLNDMHHYASALNDPGIILFSGFYEQDIAAIDAAAASHGLKSDGKIVRNHWVALKYVK